MPWGRSSAVVPSGLQEKINTWVEQITKETLEYNLEQGYTHKGEDKIVATLGDKYYTITYDGSTAFKVDMNGDIYGTEGGSINRHKFYGNVDGVKDKFWGHHYGVMTRSSWDRQVESKKKAPYRMAEREGRKQVQARRQEVKLAMKGAW